MLLDGNSLSSVERITDVHHGTILKLLVLAGEKCENVMGRLVVNVKVRDVECDELWAFIGKKQKRVSPDDDPNLGDAYTFVAIERHSKLVLNFALGSATRPRRTFSSKVARRYRPGPLPNHDRRFCAVPYRHSEHP